MEQSNPEKNLHEYSIDEQFEMYLKLVHLDKRKMPANQVTEMKRCFFGAFGQFLFIAQELEGLPIDKAAAAIKSLQNQVSNFFNKPPKA